MVIRKSKATCVIEWNESHKTSSLIQWTASRVNTTGNIFLSLTILNARLAFLMALVKHFSSITSLFFNCEVYVHLRSFLPPYKHKIINHH